eukprot:SAG11_NODE_2054_length_3878_cov_1.867161_1_plen_72_part_00
MMMPFVDWAPEVSFKKPIDSIAVSGHKMLGCPMPCGVALTRKTHVQKVRAHTPPAWRHSRLQCHVLLLDET